MILRGLNHPQQITPLFSQLLLVLANQTVIISLCFVLFMYSLEWHSGGALGDIDSLNRFLK